MDKLKKLNNDTRKQQQDVVDERDIIDEYTEELMIDVNALDTEIIRQATTYNKVAQAAVNAASRRDKLQEETKQVDAELNAKFRKQQSQTRITDSAIAALVLQDQKHQDAYERYLNAKLRAERLSIIKDSFNMRSFMLRDLVQLYAIGYFTDNAVRPKHGAAGDAAYNAARKRMSDARRSKAED